MFLKKLSNSIHNLPQDFFNFKKFTKTWLNNDLAKEPNKF